VKSLAEQRFLLAVARRSFRHLRPRMLANFARYRLSWQRLRASGPGRLPYTPPDIFFWVTTRCNQDCNFCLFRGELNVPGELDLSLERFETFLQHRLVRNAFRLCLFGGEPLLNADAFKMVQAGHRHGHLMTMNTNGILLAERYKELYAHTPDMLTVSYYPENRDVLADGLARVATKAPIYLHYVYSADLLDGILEAAEFASSHGALALGFENLYPTGKTSDRPVDEGDPALEEIRREVDERYGRRLCVKWLESRSRSAAARQEPTVCRMMWARMVVDVEGRWSACCAWPRDSYGGNLFEEDDAWNGPRMLAARSAMRSPAPPEQCRGCDWLYDELLSL